MAIMIVKYLGGCTWQGVQHVASPTPALCVSVTGKEKRVVTGENEKTDGW